MKMAPRSSTAARNLSVVAFGITGKPLQVEIRPARRPKPVSQSAPPLPTAPCHLCAKSVGEALIKSINRHSRSPIKAFEDKLRGNDGLNQSLLRRRCVATCAAREIFRLVRKRRPHHAYSDRRRGLRQSARTGSAARAPRRLEREDHDRIRA